MLGFYVFYVAYVTGWHWWLSRKVEVEYGAEEEHAPNERETSSEETPLLPETQVSKALRHVGNGGSRRQPEFWENWADDSQHKVDYQSINPGIGETIRFRHKELLRRHDKACEVSTSNGQDGPCQIPPERHRLEAHESSHTGASSRRSLRRIYEVLFPSLQALETNTSIHRFVNITIAPIVLSVRLTLPVAD